MSTANLRNGRRAGLLALLLVAFAPGANLALASAPPVPNDDLIFRPTVVVRKGQAQGSGTIIASSRGETLVLTASHVVEDSGPLRVELHRYNLGAERTPKDAKWPLAVEAELVAADVAADVAILRLRKLDPLPFVARLNIDETPPAQGTIVTSVGIDLGVRLSSWRSRVASIDRFEIEGRGAERHFLITSKAPEHGRSGGGLFLPSGELVGVCVGRAEFVKGTQSGVFASGTSIRRLLREHDLDARLLAPAPAAPAGNRLAPITTTRARPAR